LENDYGDGEERLRRAARDGDVGLIKELIDSGVSVNAAEESGQEKVSFCQLA